MAKVLGKNSILFLYVGGATDAYLPIACLTTNGVQKTWNFNEGTITKCDANPDPVPTNKTLTFSFEGETDNKTGVISYEAIDELADEAHDNNDPLFFKIETTYSDDTTSTKYGKGFLTDLSADSPADGNQTFSGNVNILGGSLSNTDLQGV